MQLISADANANAKPINDKLSNIDLINATTGENENKGWTTFDFEYALGKDDMQKELVSMSYVKSQKMPMGGYLQDGDVNHDNIVTSLEATRKLYPKYTSNKLLAIKAARIVGPQGSKLIYTYDFNKNDTCYSITYSIKDNNVIDSREIECH